MISNLHHLVDLSFVDRRPFCHISCPVRARLVSHSALPKEKQTRNLRRTAQEMAPATEMAPTRSCAFSASATP